MFVKLILSVLKEDDYRFLNLRYYPDKQLIIELYDSELPIVFDFKTNEVYIDGEMLFQHKNITTEVVNDLQKIMQVIEDQKNEIKIFYGYTED